MATRTISNLGGNYNAVATWVEGVVPTSADDVVATSTSGNLTINVSSAASTINLTNYTGTITMNSNWTVSGGSGVNVISVSGMTWNAGTGGILILSASNQSISSTGTQRVPYLRLSIGSKTLTSDLYCINFDVSSNFSLTINGFTIYVSGNLGVDGSLNAQSPFVTNPSGVAGTTKFVLDGSGNIFFSSANSISITGSYSTPYDRGLSLISGASASITGTVSNFNLYLSPTATAADAITLNCNKTINLILINSIINGNSLYKAYTVNLQSNLTLDNLVTSPWSRLYTSDNTVKSFIFSGGSLSASNVSLVPSWRTGSSTTAPTITYLGPDIRLQSGLTHTFGNMLAIGGFGANFGSNRNALISSTTPGSQANINLISKTASQIVNYSFQDINASSGQQIVAINGTFSNTSNITNLYPSGGSGVSGGSWTFVN